MGHIRPEANPRWGTARIRRLPIWTLRRPALAFILAVDGAGLAAIVALWLIAPATSGMDWLRFAVLTTAAVAYTELSARVEILRRYLSTDGVMAGMYTIWVVAAALALPARLALLVALVLTAHTVYWAVQRKSTPPFRLIFVGLACALAGGAAAGIATAARVQQAVVSGHWGWTTAVALLGAAITFEIVDALVVMTGVYLAQRPPRFRDLMMNRDNLAMEAVTLILATFMALVLAQAIWLVPAIWLVLIVVQRSVLVGQLQQAVDTDAKTGLLTSVSWQQRADRELNRASRTDSCAAVLVIDLDHFKRVNDERGHLAGDAVLKAAADGLRAELRDYDMAGRHGGEEFTVLAPGADAAQALDIANRIRASIAASTAACGGDAVTASIGIACYPAHGIEVRELFAVADATLYDAKRAGRDLALVAPELVPVSL